MNGLLRHFNARSVASLSCGAALGLAPARWNENKQAVRSNLISQTLDMWIHQHICPSEPRSQWPLSGGLWATSHTDWHLGTDEGKLSLCCRRDSAPLTSSGNTRSLFSHLFSDLFQGYFTVSFKIPKPVFIQGKVPKVKEKLPQSLKCVSLAAFKLHTVLFHNSMYLMQFCLLPTNHNFWARSQKRNLSGINILHCEIYEEMCPLHNLFTSRKKHVLSVYF